MTTLREENPLGTAVLVIATVFYALAVIACGLRILSRRLKKFPLNLSDYSIAIALVTSTAVFGLMITAVLGGLGQHIGDLTAEKVVRFAKVEIAFSVIWFISVTAVKVSILHLYITIFTGNAFLRICWGFLGFQLVFCACIVLQLLLICRPIAKNWNPLLPGHCGDPGKAYLTSHIIILLVDISIALLPTPVLWRLKMPLSKKITVSFLFGIGIVICAISLMRIVWYSHVDGPDITYNWAPLFLFTCLEPFIGITLACLPFMKPVASKIANSSAVSWTLQRLRFSTRSGSARYNTSPGNSRTKRFNRLPERLQGIDNNSDAKIQTTIEAHTLDDLEDQGLDSRHSSVYDNTIQISREWGVGTMEPALRK